MQAYNKYSLCAMLQGASQELLAFQREEQTIAELRQCPDTKSRFPKKLQCSQQPLNRNFHESLAMRQLNVPNLLQSLYSLHLLPSAYLIPHPIHPFLQPRKFFLQSLVSMCFRAFLSSKRMLRNTRATHTDAVWMTTAFRANGSCNSESCCSKTTDELLFQGYSDIS